MGSGSSWRNLVDLTLLTSVRRLQISWSNLWSTSELSASLDTLRTGGQRESILYALRNESDGSFIFSPQRTLSLLPFGLQKPSL